MKRLISLLALLCVTGGSTLFAWGWSHSLISYLAHGFPAYWTVEYSLNGVDYTTAVDDVLLRPIAYEKSPMSYYAAPGYLENSIVLPKNLLGKKKVYLRIRPASEVMVETHEDPSLDINSGVYSPEKSRDFALVIGKVSVKALK